MNIFTYFIIPGYSLFLAKGYNWFTTNFSVIGNVDKRLAFAVWGVLIGTYFYRFNKRMKSLLDMGPVCSRLIPSALLLLFCGITTPYLPEELPFRSFLHIIFAMLATVCLFFFLLTVIWKQFKHSPKRFWPFLLGLGVIVINSLLLLDLAKIISSALELFITITSVILSDRLARTIEKNPRVA